jgi:hypothetical protein
MIQRLVPNARVGIGHGQMEGKKLELMLAFMNGEFDVLVATTIIESGLDVPMPIRFSIMLIILVCLTCIRCEVVWTATRRRFVILSAVFSND